MLKIVYLRLESENDGIPSTAIREISLLKELQHPNIVCLQDVLMEEYRLYLIFEYLSMDLKRYIDKIEPGTYMDPMLVKSYLYQVNDAILYCHQRRVLHRDLKPQNLLIGHNGTIKVSAFFYVKFTSVLYYRRLNVKLQQNVSCFACYSGC